MKRFIFLIVLIGFTATSFILNKTEDILTLQKNKAVELTIIGNAESTHYLDPIIVTVTNKTNKTIETEFPAGLHFTTVEDGYQDVISTQQRMLVLAPNSSKNIPIPGLCIQRSNSAPNGETQYVLSAYAKNNMRELANFLDVKNIQGSQAQQAMWVLSDGNSPLSIIGLDDRFEHELIDKTTELAGLPKVPEKDYKQWKEGVRNPIYTSSIKGYFKFEFPRKTKVQIAIFNEDHVLIKEVYNQEVEAGFHKVDYKMETTDYEGQKIISQMIAYNRVVSKRTIDLRGR